MTCVYNLCTQLKLEPELRRLAKFSLTQSLVGGGRGSDQREPIRPARLECQQKEGSGSVTLFIILWKRNGWLD